MSTSPPLPPPELAAYVWGGTPPADWEQAFDAGGAELRRQLERLVPGAIGGGARVLDFGCGSGRLLRQLLPEAGTGAVHGVDIDDASIAWVQQHLCPPCHAAVAPSAPPLAFEDESFDIVVAVSVLSQIAEHWADWLLELRRILRPGGLLVASLMGIDRAPIIAGGLRTDDQIGMSIHGYGRPWEAGGPMILHSDWWVRAHYGRAFTVRGYHPRALNDLDTYVLERPAGVAAPTAAELIAPEPGEPREVSAAQYDIARLHRDYAALNAAHDAYATAYATESARSVELQAALDAARSAEPAPTSPRRRFGR